MTTSLKINYFKPKRFLLSNISASNVLAADSGSGSTITLPPVIPFNPSVKTWVTNGPPVINGGKARWSGSPKAKPNAPSANACSSNHCGAESATGNCGISTFNAAANSLTTISILPIARHGPKFNTGGIFNFLQTAFKFSPANS